DCSLHDSLPISSAIILTWVLYCVIPHLLSAEGELEDGYEEDEQADLLHEDLDQRKGYQGRLEYRQPLHQPAERDKHHPGSDYQCVWPVRLPVRVQSLHHPVHYEVEREKTEDIAHLDSAHGDDGEYHQGQPHLLGHRYVHHVGKCEEEVTRRLEEQPRDEHRRRKRGNPRYDRLSAEPDKALDHEPESQKDEGGREPKEGRTFGFSQASERDVCYRERDEGPHEL